MMTATTNASSFYTIPLRSTKRHVVHVICASHEPGREGRRVDEGMVVLRMRIHEARARARVSDEAGEGQVARSDWMEWERKYYDTSYNSDVCEAVGILQSKLMSARPSSALATVAILSISVPVSLGVILVHLAKVLVGFGL